MGFRFRKSVKIAPGVKLNFGKKGTSVTVGNKYARTTIGKDKKTVSASIPGTGVSYVKQTSKKKKPTTAPSSNNFSSATNHSAQQMEWSTALKIIKWTFYTLLGFILLMMIGDSLAVLIGVALIIGGMILTKMKKQGRIQFTQTWIVSAFGWILALFLWVSGLEPTEEAFTAPVKINEVNSLISTSEQLEPVVETKVEEEPIVELQPEEVAEEIPVATEEPVEDVVTEEPETIEEAIEREPVIEREYFKNCKELNSVYPNGVPADHPAYDTVRDRDKDGWACER